MPYVGKSPSNGVRNRFYFTASGGETSLSGADDNSKTLTFSDAAYVDVILNGNTLVSGTDYTAANNTISSFSPALDSDDVVEIVAYDIFSVADTVSASSGGTFNGNVTMSKLSADSGVFSNDVTLSKSLTVDSNGTISGTLTLNNSDHQQLQLEGTRPTAFFKETDGNANENFQVRVNEGKLLFQQQNDAQSNAQTKVAISQIGNLGIGSTAVDSNSYDDITDDGAGLVLGTGSVSNAGVQIRTSSSGTGRIYFGDNSGDDGGRRSGAIEYNHSSNYMSFRTSGSEWMRITPDGDIGLLGATSPVANSITVGPHANPRIFLKGNGSGYTEGAYVCQAPNDYRGGGIYMYNDEGSNTDTEWYAGRVYANADNYHICFKSNPTNIGQDTAQSGNKKFILYQNGNYDFTGSDVSDRRLKQDISDDSDALAGILQLQTKKFRFKKFDSADDSEALRPMQHGFIAQDVKNIFPLLVTGDSSSSHRSEFLGLDYNGLTALLVRAVQEQNTIINDLKTRISALEDSA